MTVANGHANRAATSTLPPIGRASLQYSDEEIRKLAAELEKPFDPHVVEWRVANTSNNNGNLRGQLVAYADSRAYQDRLNILFTPAGWTRRYDRQFSGQVERGRDQKMVAKVFVTCELTIHGLGSNSSTGEAWCDDDNGGTTAEAQAFKRAASCFGLGRYLYDVEEVWVDLDERKRPLSTPSLPQWATPGGWAKGLRPQPSANKESSPPAGPRNGSKRQQRNSNQDRSRQSYGKATNPPSETVAKIEQMHTRIGSPLYRGILKRIAKVWNPADIGDEEMERKALAEMEEAERLRQRFEALLQQVGEEIFHSALRMLQLRSFHQIDSAEVLAKLVREMESRAPEPF